MGEIESTSSQLGGSHGWLSKHAGHWTTVTVITANPHFLHLYGPSPVAEPSKMALAPGCEKAAVMFVFAFVLLSVFVLLPLPCCGVGRQVAQQQGRQLRA